MFKKIVVLSMLLVFVLSLSTLPSFAANGTITTQKTPFDRALKSGKPVIVKLGADWCPACREMKPNLEAAAKELGDKAVVLDLDIDKYRNLASVYKINLIPTTLFYNKNGKFVEKKVGLLSKKELLDTLKKISK